MLFLLLLTSCFLQEPTTSPSDPKTPEAQKPIEEKIPEILIDHPQGLVIIPRLTQGVVYKSPINLVCRNEIDWSKVKFTISCKCVNVAWKPGDSPSKTQEAVLYCKAKDAELVQRATWLLDGQNIGSTTFEGHARPPFSWPAETVKNFRNQDYSITLKPIEGCQILGVQTLSDGVTCKVDTDPKESRLAIQFSNEASDQQVQFAVAFRYGGQNYELLRSILVQGPRVGKVIPSKLLVNNNREVRFFWRAGSEQPTEPKVVLESETEQRELKAELSDLGNSTAFAITIPEGIDANKSWSVVLLDNESNRLAVAALVF